MKKLFLIRHAKSSWDNPEHSDFDRPLNERGLKDAPEMAKLLQSKNIFPDLIISSTANRAFSTAQIFAEIYNHDEKNIFAEENIYEASTRDLISVVSSIDDKFSNVFMFGHNPGISSFANYLSTRPVYEMPTCAIAGLELNINSWKEIEKNCGSAFLFEYPKKY